MPHAYGTAEADAWLAGVNAAQNMLDMHRLRLRLADGKDI
jgi:hypothetical protein